MKILITKQRAEELLMLSKEIWDKDPNGFSSYYSTLCEIKNGRVEG